MYEKASRNLEIYDPLRIEITLEYAEYFKEILGNEKASYKITNAAL